MTLFTLDDKTHMVFDDDSVLDLIREYMGDDTYKYIKLWIGDLDIQLEEEKENSEYIEMQFDGFIQEMKDGVEWIQELLNKPHTKKSNIIKAVQQLYDTVLEHI